MSRASSAPDLFSCVLASEWEQNYSGPRNLAARLEPEEWRPQVQEQIKALSPGNNLFKYHARELKRPVANVEATQKKSEFAFHEPTAIVTVALFAVEILKRV